MKFPCYLVANSSHAVLLQDRADGPTRVIRAFEHADSRAAGHELDRDRAGHGMRSGTARGVSLAPRMSAHEKEQWSFARELAHELEVYAREGSCESIHVFAPNPFLGDIVRVLGPAARRLLAGSHPVDLSRVGPAEIGERIRRELSGMSA